ncbi:MAG: metal-dependent transcriptional regulator [Planctomycetes bacterium]|nr:metal-dependent transcriptional regulator [Planctomycetota bacterium]
MPSTTVENYVKRIYLESQHGAGKSGLVPMGRLASAVGVAPGTATAMIKTLAEIGIVTYEPRGGVRLSRKGEKLALHVLRRHRLIELFLVRVLGFDWADVHKEAEELEHSISDVLLDRIDAYLDRPAFDPHGDPIPTARGTVDKRRLTPLSDTAPGRRVHIARVIDQDARFLGFLQESGLKPGRHVTVESRDDAADAITLRTADDQTVTLGRAAAAKLLVAAAGKE